MKGIRISRKLIIAFFICAAIVALSMTALSNLSNMLLSMAEAKAGQRAINEINEAMDAVLHESFEYSDLMTVSYDETGAVSMLTANTILMNRIASDGASVAQANIDKLAEDGIELPLGAALGSSALSGMGPNIRFEFLPVGSVTTTFVTEFESAGINQTRHKISLETTATVRIVIPTGAKTVTVKVTTLMVESILVGSVPESYLLLSDTSRAVNLVP